MCARQRKLGCVIGTAFFCLPCLLRGPLSGMYQEKLTAEVEGLVFLIVITLRFMWLTEKRYIFFGVSERNLFPPMVSLPCLLLSIGHRI